MREQDLQRHVRTCVHVEKARGFGHLNSATMPDDDSSVALEITGRLHLSADPILFFARNSGVEVRVKHERTQVGVTRGRGRRRRQ
jgi:hypothetical protein